MDTATFDIPVVEFAPRRDRDGPVLQDLQEKILVDENISSVTSDGAYDTGRCQTTILAHDAVPIFPIRKNGRS
jgi:hypothetical protein